MQINFQLHPSAQVHTTVEKCYNTVACTCAVSIRSGDDVIVVDSCRERALAKGGNMMVDVLLNGELTPGTLILSENNGRKIKVS